MENGSKLCLWLPKATAALCLMLIQLGQILTGQSLTRLNFVSEQGSQWTGVFRWMQWIKWISTTAAIWNAGFKNLSWAVDISRLKGASWSVPCKGILHHIWKLNSNVYITAVVDSAEFPFRKDGLGGVKCWGFHMQCFFHQGEWKESKTFLTWGA